MWSYPGSSRRRAPSLLFSRQLNVFDLSFMWCVTRFMWSPLSLITRDSQALHSFGMFMIMCSMTPRTDKDTFLRVTQVGSHIVDNPSKNRTQHLRETCPSFFLNICAQDPLSSFKQLILSELDARADHRFALATLVTCLALSSATLTNFQGSWICGITCLFTTLFAIAFGNDDAADVVSVQSTSAALSHATLAVRLSAATGQAGSRHVQSCNLSCPKARKSVLLTNNFQVTRLRSKGHPRSAPGCLPPLATTTLLSRTRHTCHFLANASMSSQFHSHSSLTCRNPRQPAAYPRPVPEHTYEIRPWPQVPSRPSNHLSWPSAPAWRQRSAQLHQ